MPEITKVQVQCDVDTRYWVRQIAAQLGITIPAAMRLAVGAFVQNHRIALPEHAAHPFEVEYENPPADE